MALAVVLIAGLLFAAFTEGRPADRPVASLRYRRQIGYPFGGAQGLGFGQATGQNARINSNSFANTGLFGGSSAGGTSLGQAYGPGGSVFTVGGGQTPNASGYGIGYVDRK